MNGTAEGWINWRAAGVIFTMLATVASLVWYQSSHDTETEYGITRATEHRVRLDKVTAETANRVRALEKTDASINQKLTKIQTEQQYTGRVLLRIEKKMDKVLERRSP